MNQNKTILWICSLMFLGMILLSFVDIFIYKTPFSNINILSSLFVKKTPLVAIKKVAI